VVRRQRLAERGEPVLHVRPLPRAGGGPVRGGLLRGDRAARRRLAPLGRVHVAEGRRPQQAVAPGAERALPAEAGEGLPQLLAERAEDVLRGVLVAERAGEEVQHLRAVLLPRGGDRLVVLPLVAVLADGALALAQVGRWRWRLHGHPCIPQAPARASGGAPAPGARLVRRR